MEKILVRARICRLVSRHTQVDCLHRLASRMVFPVSQSSSGSRSQIKRYGWSFFAPLVVVMLAVCAQCCVVAVDLSDDGLVGMGVCQGCGAVGSVVAYCLHSLGETFNTDRGEYAGLLG